MSRFVLTSVLAVCATCGTGPASPGPGQDAGAGEDGGVEDASTPGPDAGGIPGCPGFAGCTTFDDRTDPSAARTVSFACCAYTPHCMRIKAGQAVTFSGSFTAHPLAQACGPAPVVSNSAGPFTFDAPGAYGYFCEVHGGGDGSGMAGAIEGVP
jgi:plastocyanin